MEEIEARAQRLFVRPETTLGSVSESEPGRWRLVLKLTARPEFGGKRHTASHTVAANSKPAATIELHKWRNDALTILCNKVEDLTKQPTLLEFVDRAEAILALRRRPVSNSTRRATIDNHVAGYPIADRPIDEITGAEMQRHLIYLQTEVVTTRGKGLSRSSVAKAVQAMSAGFKHAQLAGLNVVDLASVAWAAPGTQVAKPAERLPAMDPVDLVKLIDAATLMEAKLALRIAAATGCRRGEIIGICWEDLENKGGYRTLHILRSVTQNAKGEVFVNPPKTEAGVRRVPVPVALWDDLFLLRTAREVEFGPIPDHHYIFDLAYYPSGNDGAVERNTLTTPVRFNSWLSRAAINAGLVTVEQSTHYDQKGLKRYRRRLVPVPPRKKAPSWHQIRRLDASQMAMNPDIPPIVMQQLLGHARFETTAGYIRDSVDNSEVKQAAIEYLDELHSSARDDELEDD